MLPHWAHIGITFWNIWDKGSTGDAAGVVCA